MNRFRLWMNVFLAVLLLAGGVYLLGQDALVLRDRWHPETGTRFTGVALHLLAFGLMLLGALAGAIANGWRKGTLPMPNQKGIRPHPTYKGTLILRFWYLAFPAVLCILLAFVWADKTLVP